MNDTDILAILRAETHDAHMALHDHPQLVKLTASDITKPYFTHVIEKFYGYHQGLETVVCRGPHRDLYNQTVSRSLDDLRHDLGLLGRDPTQSDIFEPPLDFNSRESVFAYLYLKEGSTLGGRIIHKSLIQNLDGYSDDFHYFKGHGIDTGANWKRFQATLNDQANGLNAAQLVDNANILFRALYNWMAKGA